jgi:hypothetical protein
MGKSIEGNGGSASKLYVIFFQYPKVNFCEIVIVLGMLFGECCFMLFRQFFVKPTFVANEFGSDCVFVWWGVVSCRKYQTHPFYYIVNCWRTKP